MAVAGLTHADLRSDLAAARHKLEKAVLAKDSKDAEAIMKETMTSDFKYTQDGKDQDLKTFIDNFTATIAMMDKISSSSVKVLSLKQMGDSASGKFEHSMVGTMKTPDKKIHKIDWTGVFTEGYRKVGGKWKNSTMIAGPQKFLMDGKPAKM